MFVIRILILIALFTAASHSMYGQLSLPSYQPSVCATSAKNAISGASDGQVVAVAAVGVEVDLQVATVFVGMNLTDGKSSLWLYLVHSASLDTAVWVPLIRPLGSCTPPPVELPLDNLDVMQIGTSPIPANAIEGAAVVNAVKMNSEYQAFNTAHPDSVQFLSVLAVSTEEVLTFPIGTPFWILTWTNVQNPTTPFNCVVHAINGQTICFGGDVSSVDDENGSTITQVWPNPASDVATIKVPSSAAGQPLSIEAYSPTGERIVLLSDVFAIGDFVQVSTHDLNNGVWYVRVLGADTSAEHATTHLIIQR